MAAAIRLVVQRRLRTETIPFTPTDGGVTGQRLVDVDRPESATPHPEGDQALVWGRRRWGPAVREAARWAGRWAMG